MIPIAAFWKYGLQDLFEALDVTPSDEKDPLPCGYVALADSDAARAALRAFHLRRWGGGPHDADDRRADLGEILLGLYARDVWQYPIHSVFPRCLSASGRRVSEPGIDVIAFEIADLQTEPLTDQEWFYCGEVKHTTMDRIDSPMQALSGDLNKTTLERISDNLHLIMSYLDINGHPYAPRVHRFLADHSAFAISILLDSAKLSAHGCAPALTTRFAQAQTAAGTPIVEAVVSSIEDLEGWVATTY